MNNKIKQIVTYLLFLPLIVSLAPGTPPDDTHAGDTTTMKTVELQLETFTQPGINHYTQKGDYAYASGLLFYDGRPMLGPDWSTAAVITYDGDPLRTLPKVLATMQGAIPGENQPLIWIGNDSSNQLMLIKDYPAGAPYQQTVIMPNYTSLGGETGQNRLFTDNLNLYLINTALNVYGGPYNQVFTLYSGQNAYILANWNNYLYMLTTTGSLYRFSSGQFELIYTPPMQSVPLFATPFRGYLLIGTIRNDSNLLLTQFTDESQARILQQIPVTKYGSATNGHAFAQHNGDIYFTTRNYTTNLDNTIDITVYHFDGSTVTPLRSVTTAAGTPNAIGLLNWQDKLVLYVLRTGTNPTHHFYTLDEDRFTLLNLITDTGTVANVTADLIGQQLILNRTIGTGAHFSVLGNGPITSATHLANATLETGTLNFGSARTKLLHAITVQLSADSTNVTTTIKYKLDHAASWTTATSGTGGRVTIENLEQEFHTLDIRIELTHTTATTPLSLETISILVTTP